MIQSSEKNEKLSIVQIYARDAQAPFRIKSMKEIANSGMYTGPPKYLSQRDQPMEIPMECIRRLCNQIDTSMDERTDLKEI